MGILPPWVRWFYIVGLVVAAGAMPWNRQILNVALMILGAAWVTDGLFHSKRAPRLRRFLHPDFLLPSSMFLVYVLGLIWTEDLVWGGKLVAIVIPLLLYPFYFAVIPALTQKELSLVLITFISATLIVTLVGFFSTHANEINDFRDYSPIISHIRLGMMVCMSVAICARWIFTASGPVKWLTVPVLIWFIYYLNILASFQGLFVLAVLMLYGLWNLGKWRAEAGIVGRALAVLSVLGGVAIVIITYQDYFSDRSFSGVRSSKYVRAEYPMVIERGRAVWQHVSPGELEEAWNERSAIDLSGKDRKGQKIYHTICRYMTSLDLPKNAAGVSHLSDADIDRIESGIAWADMGLRNPVRERLDMLYFQWDNYRRHGYTAGSSLTMRLVFWETAWNLIKENWLIGVGTGDTQLAFDEAYVSAGSSLPREYRLRAHQQFLTWWLSFGLIGFLWLLFAFIYPIVRRWRSRHPLFEAFLLIALTSFMTDDTLERQIGVTIFAFFYGLFLLSTTSAAEAHDTPSGF